MDDIARIIGYAVFSGEAPQKIEDWDGVINTANKHAIFPILFSVKKQFGHPAKI